MAKFNDGDEIYKIGGRYGGPCRVVGSAIEIEPGYLLYTCAMVVKGGYGEFVHVFPESALSATPDPRQIEANDFAGLADQVKPEEEPGESTEFPGRLITSLLGSGWAAVHIVKVNVRKEGGEDFTYEDIQQTGVGRYASQHEAWVEAKMWSESDEIPFDEAEPPKPAAKTPVAKRVQVDE